jgi:hypothetical protein
MKLGAGIFEDISDHSGFKFSTRVGRNGYLFAPECTHGETHGETRA